MDVGLFSSTFSISLRHGTCGDVQKFEVLRKMGDYVAHRVTFSSSFGIFYAKWPVTELQNLLNLGHFTVQQYKE